MVFFSFKTYLNRIFLLEFTISVSALTPVPNFSSIGQKKGTRILTWNDTKIGLMTSAKFLWLSRDFVPEYHHAKLGCNWTTNKGETEGSTMVPKDPSLNSVKGSDREVSILVLWHLSTSGNWSDW